MLKHVPAGELFSWASPSFKALGLDRDKLTDDDLVRLMLKEPRLIKRPITRIGDRFIVGGNPKQLAEAMC